MVRTVVVCDAIVAAAVAEWGTQAEKDYESGAIRSPLLEGDELVRYHWYTLDRTLSNQPVGVVLLDGVEGIQFRFLTESGDMSDQWPPATRPGALGTRQRPRAVEVILRLTDEGDINRLIEVAP